MSFTFNLRNEIIKDLGFNPETREKRVVVGRTAALQLSFPVQFDELYQWTGLSATPLYKETDFAIAKYKKYIEPAVEKMYIGKEINTYGALFYRDLSKSYQKISFLSPLGFFTTTIAAEDALKIPKNQIISFSGRISATATQYFPNTPSLYSFTLKQFNWKPIIL